MHAGLIRDQRVSAVGMPMSDWTQLTTASGVYLWFVNIAKQVATTTPAIYGRAGWIPKNHQPCGRAGCLHDKHNGRARAGCLSTKYTGCYTPFHITQHSFCKCRTVRHPASPVPDWKECICRNQFGTGIREPSPVPDWVVGLRNAVDSLDADALLYIKASSYFALMRLYASKIFSRKIRKTCKFCRRKGNMYKW